VDKSCQGDDANSDESIHVCLDNPYIIYTISGLAKSKDFVKSYCFFGKFVLY